MKKALLFTILILLLYPDDSIGQECCSIFKKSINSKKPPVNIYFDEKGIPLDDQRQYMFYGSQVNLIAKNINPLEQLPEIKTFFKDYYVAPSDMPDIGKLISQDANPEQNAPSVKKEAETAQILGLKANAAEANFTSKIKGFKNLSNSYLLETENLLDSIRQSSNPIKTKEFINDLIQKNTILETQLLANKQIADDFKKANDELIKAITKLKKLEEIAPAIRNDYNAFTRAIDSINYLLTLQPAVYKLFSQQFLDIDFTKQSIEKLIRVRLPQFKNSIDTSITIQGNFLTSNINNLEKLHSSMVENIKKANEQIASDSFGTDKTTEIELTNKDKKKVKVKIGSISIDVNKEPLFKDQLEFTTKQILRYRSQKFRDSLYVYTDTVLIQALKLYHSKFEQTIKSFQANADEIKINLPYKNSEPYVIKTRCRFKVEGSTGVFAHFFGSDDRYKVVQAAQLSGGDSLHIIKQKRENMILSLGVMANVYVYDPSKLFNTGFSVGLNFPVNNQSGAGGIAQLVAGVSFFSTTVEKLSFTLGISLRKGQALNTNNLTAINGEEKYVFNNKNTLEPTYDSVTKLGGFFGISYSLFGGKKSTQTE